MTDLSSCDYLPGAVIVVGAGSSRRMSLSPKEPQSKNLFKIKGKTIISWSVEAFLFKHFVKKIIVVVPETSLTFYQEHLFHYGERIVCIPGGKERGDSVKNGLDIVNHLAESQEITLVGIHDAARPAVSSSLIDRCWKEAALSHAVVPGTPISDTIKMVKDNKVIETRCRNNLFAIQTPQVFSRHLLSKAYEFSDNSITDDASLVERISSVTVVAGSRYNSKLTTREDLGFLEWALSLSL